jgi:hypothetical protein
MRILGQDVLLFRIVIEDVSRSRLLRQRFSDMPKNPPEGDLWKGIEHE